MPQTPRTHLLSNGRYRTLVSGAGAGMSAWGEIALTRWSADPIRDHEGFAIYLSDRDRGDKWTAGWQPLPGRPDRYATRSGPGVATIERSDGGVETRLDIAVVPDLDAEVRLVTLTNRTDRIRRLDLTSYVEVALNHPGADAAHPAFSKLFVQTEHDRAARALLAKRRRRSPEDPSLWMAHWVDLPDGGGKMTGVETDRARFLGRGRTPADPAALDPRHRLSGTVGNVIDPILATRHAIELAPGDAVRVVAGLAAGADRDEALAIVSTIRSRSIDSVIDTAAFSARDLLDELAVPEAWRLELPRLTGMIGYRAISPKAPEVAPGAVTSMLDRLGLGGRHPIVTVRIDKADDREDAVALERVIGWWRRQGLPVDLVTLTGGDGGHSPREAGDRGRSVSIRARDLDSRLRAALDRATSISLETARSRPVKLSRPESERFGAAPAPRRPTRADPAGLEGFNGFGGFAAGGREYRILLDWRDGRLAWPPLPWANVIANPDTGVIVTERGIGTVWTANSRENRLTPWRNDPVSDPPGVVLYLRDHEANELWSPLPGPAPGPAGYQVTHGLGWTEWRHHCRGLDLRTTVFVPVDDPVVVIRMSVTNPGDRHRQLSLLACAELVLGVQREEAVRWVTTTLDRAGVTLFATNHARGEFSERVAFATLGADRQVPTRLSGDRAGFLGPLGSVERPAAAVADGLPESRVGAGLDPAAVAATEFALEPGGTITFDFVLGEASDRAAAERLAAAYRDETRVDAEWERVRTFWEDLTSRVEVTSPSPAIDLMVNGWLPYQNLSCRVWGRSAFYQSGGAFGFRDQLQDSLALIWQLPDLTRNQILLHAAHQFPEGDVLHWWHPPTAKGIRTRFSDDLLWLPYAVAFYLGHTGDRSILDERLPFVDGPPLDDGEDERFFTPDRLERDATLFEHCCLALDRSLTRGAHGLPLMGTGDWNDGMNRVGREGRGESVWLGFFLYRILTDFLPWCDRPGAGERAARYRTYLEDLGRALNAGGWDGDWYRRAYYDSGVPLGSAGSDECRIDAIAQAWAVLSGAAPADRAGKALDAAVDRLVDREHGIIRLLTPAFDATPHDPGYIKGYLPGVRENGGQYTHGALWMVRALAEAGRVEEAAPLLEMLSPASHGAEPARIARYQVEPYVIAADVYGVAPHDGRGGWTWYTGSAGWMFRVAVESIFGLTVEHGATLRLCPALPAAWPGYTLRYRIPGREGGYRLTAEQSPTRPSRTVVEWEGPPIEAEDGAVRIPIVPGSDWVEVVIRLGRDVGPSYRPAAGIPPLRMTSA